MIQSEMVGSTSSGSNRTTQRTNSRDMNGIVSTMSSSSTSSTAAQTTSTSTSIHPTILNNNKYANASSVSVSKLKLSNQSLPIEWYQFWKYSHKVNIILSIILLYGCIFIYFLSSMTTNSISLSSLSSLTESSSTVSVSTVSSSDGSTGSTGSTTTGTGSEQININTNINTNTCEYVQLHQLSNEQKHPKATNSRYIVNPPNDTNLSLVCCITTVGSINILVHHSWAPIGAQRYIDMVESYYFDADPLVVTTTTNTNDNTNTNTNNTIQKQRGYNGVPFMRCIKKFLCQFGLGSKLQHQFDTTIQDDSNWLPEGPKYRINTSTNVKRYNIGYIAYAGNGNNSRSNQLIIALDNNEYLGGGSPWEVPFGEVIGTTSFISLSKIYTGYDDNGPSQSLLYKMSSSNYYNIQEQIQHNFPKLDYISSCTVVDRSQ